MGTIQSTPRLTLTRRFVRAASEFLTAPASPRPLACFRIGLSAILLLQALAIAGSLLELYGRHGIIQWPLVADGVPPGVPRLGWLTALAEPLGISDANCVRGLFLVYVASLSFLLLGWRTRWAAAAAWLAHVMMKVTANASVYGVDTFANIGLFYCLWMPVGEMFSLDRAAGRATGAPSWLARLSLRVLQIHLCVVYLASGLEKATGEQWWNGEAIWRALMRPDLGQFDFSWLASVPLLAKVVCWQTLLVEIGYAFFVWPRRTRKWWALATIGLHAGIAVMMGLWSFSALMATLTMCAFLISAEAAGDRRA